MHLHGECDVGTLASDGLRVITEPSAVGGAHIDQRCARLLHHIGYAKCSANLHAFAAAHGHAAVVCQRGKHQHHSGRVVVHDHCRLAAAQACEQLTDCSLPRPTLAGGEVELDVDRAGGLLRAYGSASEVGVQQHACCVHHGHQQRAREVSGADSGRSGIARSDGLAGDVDAQRVGESARCERPGERVDRRWAGLRIRHGRNATPTETR